MTPAPGLRVLTVGFEFPDPNMPTPARLFPGGHNSIQVAAIFKFRPLLSTVETGQYGKSQALAQRKAPSPVGLGGGAVLTRTTVSTGMLVRTLSRGIGSVATNVRTAPAGYTEAVCCSLLRSRPTGV
jgi:hypothetical protein